MTTIIMPGDVTGNIEPLEEYETVSLQTTPTPPGPDGSFTEHGVITFGDPGENNTLSFNSKGVGYLGVYIPEEPFTAGTVMWAIDSGTGFFEGATGAVTSNFLVDITQPPGQGELIAYHFGVIYLP